MSPTHKARPLLLDSWQSYSDTTSQLKQNVAHQQLELVSGSRVIKEISPPPLHPKHLSHQPSQPTSHQTHQPSQPTSHQTHQPSQPTSHQTHQPSQPTSHQTHQPSQPTSHISAQPVAAVRPAKLVVAGHQDGFDRYVHI